MDSFMYQLIRRVHGGGFIGGSGNFVHADHAALVALSSKLATPIIGIAINYRLGPLGFLTSSELAKVGISGNYGLKDQRTALEWVCSSLPHLINPRYKPTLEDSVEIHRK